jgi:hypothetical protein
LLSGEDSDEEVSDLDSTEEPGDDEESEEEEEGEGEDEDEPVPTDGFFRWSAMENFADDLEKAQEMVSSSCVALLLRRSLNVLTRCAAMLFRRKMLSSKNAVSRRPQSAEARRAIRAKSPTRTTKSNILTTKMTMTKGPAQCATRTSLEHP